MTLRLPTLRELRLASGLVLFTYIAAHLFNHALGLVSVSLADRGLGMALRVWHSAPGTLLLYGSAAVHVVLALQAIYQRRTLRMAPLDALRIALGLAIPTLLIGHVVGTRVAYEGYDVSPEYARVVWALWMSDGEGRQLAMLVPGWLHGCLGVYFAFGRRRLFQRLRLGLFAVALLLPVLGGLGFLAMGKELAANVADRPNLDHLIAIDAPASLALARMRDAALAFYFTAIVMVFAAREVRAIVERRRKALVAIAYPQRTIEVPRGWSVLEASRSHLIPHMSMCGGRARCSTCRVRITSGADHCPPPEPEERATLARIDAPGDVRLACQLRPTGNIGVIPLLSPPDEHRAAPRGQATAEHDVALLLVTWGNRDAQVKGRLPQDVIFLSKLFAETVTGALRAAHCDEVDTLGAKVLAVFGLSESLAPACRTTLAAMRSVERALTHLERQWMQDFRMATQFTIYAHAGPAAVGHVGTQDPRRLVVAGEAIDTLDALRAAAGPVRSVVSAKLLELAGEARSSTVWHDIAGCRAAVIARA
jgi:adenylate cyclase